MSYLGKLDRSIISAENFLKILGVYVASRTTDTNIRMKLTYVHFAISSIESLL